MKIKGNKVTKINSEPGDGHEDGTPGTLVARSKEVELNGQMIWMGFIVYQGDKVPVLTACTKFEVGEEQIVTISDSFAEYFENPALEAIGMALTPAE